MPQAEPFVVPPLPIASPQPQLDKPNKSAFGGKMQERAWNIRNHTDPLGALKLYKDRIKHALFLSLRQDGPQKFYLAVKVRFYKRDKVGNKTEVSAYFHGTMHTLLREADYDEAYQNSLNKIWIAFDIFLKNGSGWILERVEKILLNTYMYEPIGSSSYIPTPKSIIKKKAIVNVKNKTDKKCSCS